MSKKVSKKVTLNSFNELRQIFVPVQVPVLAQRFPNIRKSVKNTDGNRQRLRKATGHAHVRLSGIWRMQ